MKHVSAKTTLVRHVMHGMRNRPQWTRLTISRKLALIFLLILATAIANLLVMHAALRHLNGFAETVNVAGRLRMLSQKLAFETLRAGPDPVHRDKAVAPMIRDIETGLLALRHGGNAFDYQLKPVSPAMGPLLQNVEADWQNYKKHIDVGIAGAAQRPVLPQDFARTADHASRFLSNAEILVRALTAEIQQAQQQALATMYLLLLADGAMLLLVFAAMRRQIVYPLRQLAEHSRALGQGQYTTSLAIRSQDEIGQLALAFTHAAKRIGELIRNIEHERANLQQAESMFRGLAENSVVGVYIAQNGEFRFVNPKMAQMFGYTCDEMISSVKAFDIVPEHDRELVATNIKRRIDGDIDAVTYERKARRKNGLLFDVEVFGSKMEIEGGVATMGVMLEITERKRVDRALRALIACNQALACADDERALLTKICEIVHEISGYPFVWAGRIEAGSSDKADPVAQAGIEPELPVTAIALPLRTSEHLLGILTICSQEQDSFTQEEIGVVEELADNLAYGMVALRAESARVQYAQMLEYHANHDVLTGLANRHRLSVCLQQAISSARRSGLMVAVLLLDLDRFKVINDSLGHAIGDEVLQAVASRLRACVRATDTVARLGGDEFVVVIPDLEDANNVSLVARKILNALGLPVSVANQDMYIGASIGISLFPQDGSDEGSLLKNVDMAMYRAKQTGRANYKFFTEDIRADNRERHALEAELHQALSRGDLLLHYQPKVSLRTGRIVGVEALIRWQHRERGMIPPSKFISVAEDTGLIVPLGAWVLRTACEQGRAWQANGTNRINIAVNLSARQFRHHDLVGLVRQTIRDTGIDPAWLDLEITESVIMQDAQEAVATMLELKKLGVRLSLDDFGTGYSSLNYLSKFPLDNLKIDQSFVEGIGASSHDTTIVKAVIALAHNLNLNVIAEGVESQSQIDFLQMHGCDEVQGYYFSKPVPPDRIPALLSIDKTMLNIS